MGEVVEKSLSERLAEAMHANRSFASQDVQTALLELARRVEKIEKTLAVLVD